MINNTTEGDWAKTETPSSGCQVQRAYYRMGRYAILCDLTKMAKKNIRQVDA